MASVVRLQSSLLRILAPKIDRRLIFTTVAKKIAADAEKCKEAPVKSKNWMSYGFDIKDEENDRISMHSAFFWSVTLCITIGSFYYMYCPDYNLRDWAQREAFLQLSKREQQGLPLIDPNLIAPEKIALPSESELGDTEIII